MVNCLAINGVLHDEKPLNAVQLINENEEISKLV